MDTTRLLGETWNLDRLTRMPAYTTGHASSADPASTSPDEPNAWFSNHDRGNFQGTITVAGREESVLLDATGPGVLTRLWTATPQGTLRVYLDCDEQPVVEVPMSDLFAGGFPPMRDPFAYGEAVLDETHLAGNLYFPIPFQSRIVVTDDRGRADVGTGAEDLFYQVDYRKLPAGTVVESYAPSARVSEAATAVAPMLESQPASTSGPTATATLSTSASELALPDAGGGSRVTRIEVRPSTLDPAALRGAIFVARFDGEETVRVPLGDFFGTRAGQGTYRSLPMEVDADGTYVSRWPMPYEADATLSVEMPPSALLTVDMAAWVEEAPFTEDTLRFHAGWADSGVLVASRQDIPVVEVRGRGVYVGTTLSIVNDSQCWWGEGDERIWVDDDTVPSVRGTGAEDYFGSAWALPVLFSRPYHGQTLADVGRSTRPCASADDFGGTMSMYRWHIADPIPFERRLGFDFELWHWDPQAHVVYETVSYWYARPGATDDAMRPAAGEPAPLDVADL